MRITIKTLQQTQFPVEIEPECTVLDVKGKISQMVESKQVPVEHQKLIHAGRILENETKVSETAMKEGDFVVLMTVVPKSTTTSTTTSSSTIAAPVKGGDKTATRPGPNSTAESKLVTGLEYEEAVGRMVDMGFDRSEVVAAMRASYNNPERAVEYLTSGVIPSTAGGEGTEVELDSEGGTENEAEVALSEEDEEEAQERTTGSGTNAGVLEFLRHDPQFQQLRSLIQQNPEMLGPIIEQLSHTSPEFLQLIEQNREEFYSLLANDDSEGNHETGGTELPEGAQVIQVTEEEQAAISRLEAMGFDRARVIEAFFACDKNEELAANYLLEHINDD